ITNTAGDTQAHHVGHIRVIFGLKLVDHTDQLRGRGAVIYIQGVGNLAHFSLPKAESLKLLPRSSDRQATWPDWRRRYARISAHRGKKGWQSGRGDHLALRCTRQLPRYRE